MQHRPTKYHKNIFLSVSNQTVSGFIIRKIKTILLSVFLLLASAAAFSQNDSINKQNDSINTSLIQAFNKKLSIIEAQRLTDSIKKVELEKQLLSLKTTDNLKKEDLEKQLLALHEKDSLRLTEKKAQINSMRLTAKGYPVNGFFNDTLFHIYSKLGSFSAKDRADAISVRITNLADQYGFNADSIKTVETETSLDLVNGESIIMSITENDALWNNTTKQTLAKKYKALISAAIIKYKSETSLATLAKEIGLALLVLIIMFVLISYLKKFFKWTAFKIKFQEDKRIQGIKIRNFILFDAKQQVNALLNINTVLKWLLIALLVYIALPILFGIFPWTKGFASTLFGYILNPLKKIGLGFWNYLPNLITILVIIFVFRYVLKGIKFLKNEIEKGNLELPGFFPDWANPTYQIIRVIVFAFMVVVIFPYLPGSDSPVFQGVSVFLGFLFTFGSAGSLSNIIAGLILTYMRLFKIGDRVKIGEVVGDVIEKSLLVTRIRTIKNEIISIPNSTVMSSHTINYSSDAPEKGLIIHSTVTIGYDVPWKDMHQALIDAALKTALILQEPKPFVLQTSLDDFYVSYEINAYIKEPNKQAVIYSDLHQNIQDVCNERGIEIMSPHYRAARDGNRTTIPENYLDKEYQAPPFNVTLKKE
ncbi:mechanosensitive ion channel family protein [Flavobacterium frigoris]|uniref:Mechanosensitive ion channel n=1 Tax=Flavobacterium frigoris TaxID=229204 RepID=A0A1H9ML93_FLAFI|nr:mechanosensitive ion channel family protein [Flavobacterium frigoris]SER23923.1 Mechanosensitive ion channel [Flavobacterium frigoris]